MIIGKSGGTVMSLIVVVAVLVGFIFLSDYVHHGQTGKETLKKWEDEAKKIELDFKDKIEHEINVQLSRLNIGGNYSL
jgi:hypothetical protein